MRYAYIYICIRKYLLFIINNIYFLMIFKNLKNKLKNKTCIHTFTDTIAQHHAHIE